MVYTLNGPEDFADEMLAGFVAAYGRFVRAVPGGVVRSTPTTPTTPSQVAVVVGGGSGHYPAFGGLVGPGLAAGAAMGNVFASPSVQQVHSVASEADAGAGVLFLFGNYMGDVLNFTAAQERLIAGGHECRLLAVTDDVASAPSAQLESRRGIAGDLTVFKVAGAAAAEGLGLQDVYELAVLANARTRSFGVAFSGCSLPGATQPLFTVPGGTMAVGMGIHGEPGLGEEPVPSADALAELLVRRLLEEIPADLPSGARRAAVVLNGLGSVKYEELFVIYGRVAHLLAHADVEVVHPEVGELITSFDMAGVSLTLMWLDARLEELWAAPAASPGFSRGSVAVGTSLTAPPAKAVSVVPTAAANARPTLGADTTSYQAPFRSAVIGLDCLRAARARLDDNVDYLGELDAVAGDGDHGIGMQRGVVAATEAAGRAVEAGAGVGSMLCAAGDAWSHRAGGTSGVLWGLMLQTAGEHLGDAPSPSAIGLAGAVAEAARAVGDFGKAQLGDKTMLDALTPFSRAMTEATGDGLGVGAAWTSAAEVAQQAAAATADLTPRIGRARPHAERSVGTPDPGAVSLAMVVTAIAHTLNEGVHSHG